MEYFLERKYRMEKEKDMKLERAPFKPGSTPIQPHELKEQRSIEESAASVKAHESAKKIRKILRQLPPLDPKIIEERDRRLGERE